MLAILVHTGAHFITFGADVLFEGIRCVECRARTVTLVGGVNLM